MVKKIKFNVSLDPVIYYAIKRHAYNNCKNISSLFNKALYDLLNNEDPDLLKKNTLQDLIDKKNKRLKKGFFDNVLDKKFSDIKNEHLLKKTLSDLNFIEG